MVRDKKTADRERIAFLPVYVISVGSFHDRHAHMNAQASVAGLTLEYIWDFDVPDLANHDLARTSDGCLPLPSVSAVLKHLHAQRLMVERDQSVCLVLEDDAILFEGFADRLAETLALADFLDPGWLIFLGGADNKIDSRFMSSPDLCLIEKPLSTAEAYLLDQAGCRRRLEWLVDHRIDKPADHFLKALDMELGVRHYWTSECLATQGSITGQFRTSLDQNRRKYSALYLKLRYWFNRVRNQIIPRLFSRAAR